MSLAATYFTSLEPDGYQVVDVTTGEICGFGENQILTYALALAMQRRIDPENTGQYMITPVTEAAVLAAYEAPPGSTRAVEYIPGFVTFAGALLRQDRPVPATQRLGALVFDPPERSDNEMTLAPHRALALMRRIGLPVPQSTEAVQYRWRIKDALYRIEQALGVATDDDPMRSDILDLSTLVREIDRHGGDLLVLDYNGVDPFSHI